jgi:hypothetical protein
MRLTPRQAADRSQASVSLIYQWCKEGLPHYRFGRRGKRGRIYIESDDLDAFVASRKVVTGEADDDGPLRFIR